MAFPEIVSREQWREARLRLLAEEKKETRRRDALNAKRRRLPMVRIEKDYIFEAAQGQVPLAGYSATATSFALVSRAPLAKIKAYRTSRGWTVPWYFSYGGEFNYDFQVTLDQSIPQVHYNYRPEPDLLGGERSTELPGHSCFLRDGGKIFHTYSTYGRGNEYTPSLYSLLDLTALGRQEDWEEPKGRAPVVHPSREGM
jgi:predicted dithiol-disulfide oxidoreductase (DUF899 family)